MKNGEPYSKITVQISKQVEIEDFIVLFLLFSRNPTPLQKS